MFIRQKARLRRVRHDFNIEVVGCIKKERERVNHAVYVFCYQEAYRRIILLQSVTEKMEVAFSLMLLIVILILE